jgi:hypothetical protein
LNRKAICSAPSSFSALPLQLLQQKVTWTPETSIAVSSFSLAPLSGHFSWVACPVWTS